MIKKQMFNLIQAAVVVSMLAIAGGCAKTATSDDITLATQRAEDAALRAEQAAERAERIAEKAEMGFMKKMKK